MSIEARLDVPNHIESALLVVTLNSLALYDHCSVGHHASRRRSNVVFLFAPVLSPSTPLAHYQVSWSVRVLQESYVCFNMAPTNLFVAGLNFTQANSFSAGLYRFAADRSLVLSGAEAWLPESASSLWKEWSSKTSEWLSRPGKLESWIVIRQRILRRFGFRSDKILRTEI